VLRRSKHVRSVVLKRESDKSTNLASSCRTFPQINQRSSITVRTPLYTCTLHRFRMRTCALHTRQVRLPGAVYQFLSGCFFLRPVYTGCWCGWLTTSSLRRLHASDAWSSDRQSRVAVRGRYKAQESPTTCRQTCSVTRLVSIDAQAYRFRSSFPDDWFISSISVSGATVTVIMAVASLSFLS